MPQFEYRARDTKGRKLKGKVEAKNKNVAASILREKGLFIVSLKDHSESTLSEINAQLSRVKSDDIVNFTRQLATMINAGLPLIQALSLLQAQAKPAMEKIIRQMIQDIEGGSNLGDALAKHSVFDKVFVSLVQAGEAAGALDTILIRLADTLEKQKEFRAKTQGALIYPGIVLTAMLVVVIVMLVFVVPRMTELYADFDAELPFATQFLIDLSSFLRNQWYVFIASAVGGFCGVSCLEANSARGNAV
ncbi:type II secretion system F family protein [Candidatus Woesebacteria bacterium]|nr:type II secretion system F family protein [Candidatus Woesebacteria bacterium]